MPVPLWQDPYEAQTVDLIQARARAQADAARQIAEYQAKAAETIGSAQASAQLQTGQAWGNAINQAGQAIGQIPGQVAQLQNQQSLIKSRDQENQLRQVQLDQANALKAGQQKIDAMQAGDQLPAGDAGPRQPSFQTPEGLWDIPKMSQALASGGSAHLAPDLLKGAETMNDSITKHQQLEMQLGQQTQLMIGDAASGALKLSKMGMAIPDAMDFVIRPMLTTGRITPAAYAKARDQITALPPDQQEAALTSLMDAAAKLDKGETLGKDASHIDRYGRVTATNVVPEPFKGDYTGPDGIRYHADGTPVTGLAMAPQRAPANAQSESFLLDGRAVKGAFVPDATGGKYMYAGEDVTARAKPIPPASVTIHNQMTNAPLDLPSWATDASRPSGPDANKLDPRINRTPNGLTQDAMTFIALGQYPQMGRGDQGKNPAIRAAIDAKVGAIAAEAGMDVPQLRAWYKANSATLTKQLGNYDSVQGFINTADKNAAPLNALIQKIPDVGIPAFNKPFREIDKKWFGNADMSQYETYLASVQSEYGRIINQPTLTGVLTDSARKEAQLLLDPNATFAQQVASLQALQNEGGNRLQSIGDQIRTIQNRMQHSSEAGQMASGQQGPPGTVPTPPPGPTQPVTVTSPSGKVYSFPTQAAADAAVARAKAAGLWR